jgi:hypothetical protein
MRFSTHKFECLTNKYFQLHILENILLNLAILKYTYKPITTNMKKILFTSIFLFIVSTIVFAQYPSSKMVVLVKAGKVKLNKKDVSKEWKLSTFTNVIDTFSRKKEGVNRVHTYDPIGMVLFEPKAPGGIVSEFQLFLDGVEASKIVPKEFFEGKLTIEKTDITRNTTIDEIRKKLMDYKETESDENDKYRFSKDGIYIYFLYNSGKKLSKVTFGKDKVKA